MNINKSKYTFCTSISTEIIIYCKANIIEKTYWQKNVIFFNWDLKKKIGSLRSLHSTSPSKITSPFSPTAPFYFKLGQAPLFDISQKRPTPPLSRGEDTMLWLMNVTEVTFSDFGEKISFSPFWAKNGQKLAILAQKWPF